MLTVRQRSPPFLAPSLVTSRPAPIFPVRSTLLLLLWLALLGSADAQNLEPFQEESPDGKFEVVCDLHAQPPFKIIRQASGETLATMGAAKFAR